MCASAGGKKSKPDLQLSAHRVPWKVSSLLPTCDDNRGGRCRLSKQARNQALLLLYVASWWRLAPQPRMHFLVLSLFPQHTNPSLSFQCSDDPPITTLDPS